jgi:PAS domain S-box-containing protein
MVGVWRRRAEAAARSSSQEVEHRYQLFLQGVQDSAFFHMDTEGRVSSWNARAESLTGHRDDEILGRTLAVFYPPDAVTLGAPREDLDRAAQRGQIVEEGWRVRRDGSRFWAQTLISAFRDPDGRLRGFAGALRDLSEKHRTEEALRTAMERLRFVIGKAPVVLYAIDRHGVITLSEGQGLQALGLRPGQVVGDSLFEMYRDVPQIVENHQRALRGEALSAEVRVEDLVWDSHLVPLRDPSGAVTGAIGVATNVTERRRAEALLRESEERLRQTQKLDALGRLAGGVAHDFNNLLMVILACAEGLLRELAADHPLREGAEEIQKAAERAADLTRRLLAFGRRTVLTPQVLDVNAAVADVEGMLRRVIGANIQVETVLEPDLGPVLADPSQVSQVLVNLAVNSRDALPEGGKITIRTSRALADAARVAPHPGVTPGPFAQIEVSDDGAGMDAATQARMFEPFFTTKEAGRGTGLGLSVVHGIVQQSGGFLEVESRPGRGTAVRVFLPFAGDAAPAGGPAPAGEAARGAARTVLLVEDEPALRRLLRQDLEEGGHRVLEAGNGEEALRLASAHPGLIDATVTDLVMPGMGGPELAGRLRARWPGMKFLFMSGYAPQGLPDPDAVFLQKPFRSVDLVRALGDLTSGEESR